MTVMATLILASSMDKNVTVDRSPQLVVSKLPIRPTVALSVLATAASTAALEIV